MFLRDRFLDSSTEGLNWNHFDDSLHHCVFPRSPVPFLSTNPASASAPAATFYTGPCTGTGWSRFFSQNGGGESLLYDRQNFPLSVLCRPRESTRIVPRTRENICHRRPTIRPLVWEAVIAKARRRTTLFISVECWPSCYPSTCWRSIFLTRNSAKLMLN